MYYNYPSIFFSSISLDMKKPGFVKKNNQCSTLQCKSCLKYERKKNTKYNTSLMKSVFFFLLNTKVFTPPLYYYIIYILHIKELCSFCFLQTFFHPLLFPLLLAFYYFFFLENDLKNTFLERKLSWKSCWSLDCLRNLSLYTSHFYALLYLYFHYIFANNLYKECWKRRN